MLWLYLNDSLLGVVYMKYKHYICKTNNKPHAMKIEALKSLSLESQIEYLESKSLLYRVVYIYDVIDSYSRIADVAELLLAYKPILTALKSVNEDLKNSTLGSKSNKDFKRSRIERIMKHNDLKPFFRDENLKVLGL